MSVYVKICGICSNTDLQQIIELSPDAVGFIQWKKSHRFVEPEIVGEWDTPEEISRVGVFVSPTEKELAHAIQYGKFDTIQVHRIPDNWYADRDFFQGIKFWNAMKPEELYFLDSYFDFDSYVLDSYNPDTIGGTGETCDWEKSSQLVKALKKPVILAGGLTVDNVQDAIRKVNPFGVDVSSGVEISPRKKDLKLVRSFIQAAKECKC